MKFSVRSLMVGVAVSALLLAVAFQVLFVPGDQQIHAMGNSLITGIEDWRTRHGRYPPTLADASLSSTTRYNGGFIYGTDEAGANFTLSIGRADGVEVQHDYTSADGRWCCHD